MCDQAVALILHRFAGDLLFLQLRDQRGQVIAHEVKLLHVVLLRRMNRDLGRRKAEDEPAFAGIDVRKPKHIAEEGAVGRDVGAVDDGMGAGDHHFA